MNNPTWDRRMLQAAVLTGSWSKDPSTKVGCLVIDADRNQLSGGYNGFPRGIADDDRLNDREQKYKIVVHAEANAVAAAARNGHSLKGGVLYTTAFPCSQCCALIIQAGIRHVVYLRREDFEKRWADDIRISQTMFQEVGIGVTAYTEEEIDGPKFNRHGTPDCFD